MRFLCASRFARFAVAALLAAGLLVAPALALRPAAPIPVASADCPGAEVVFARGREEPPGVGEVGNAFVNALRAKAPNMSIGSYGVNDPADVSASKGADDMSAHVQSMAASCPSTRLVVGGYSLGAAAADLVVAVNRPGFGFTDPLPADMDQHITAVALFGNGTRRVLGPVPDFSPAFAGKTIDLCAAGVPICGSGGALGPRICSRRTSTPGWWIRPPASSPASCSRQVDRASTQSRERRSRVITVRACSSPSGG